MTRSCGSGASRTSSSSVPTSPLPFAAAAVDAVAAAGVAGAAGVAPVGGACDGCGGIIRSTLVGDWLGVWPDGCAPCCVGVLRIRFPPTKNKNQNKKKRRKSKIGSEWRDHSEPLFRPRIATRDGEKSALSETKRSVNRPITAQDLRDVAFRRGSSCRSHGSAQATPPAEYDDEVEATSPVQPHLVTAWRSSQSARVPPACRHSGGAVPGRLANPPWRSPITTLRMTIPRMVSNYCISLDTKYSYWTI